MSTSEWDAWNYRDSVTREGEATGMVGYAVHATDGEIGKVDDSSEELDNSHLAVDTGPWIFGRTVILPAGVIERIDDKGQEIYVDLTRDQVKASPVMDDVTGDRTGHHLLVGEYYGNLFRGRPGAPDGT